MHQCLRPGGRLFTMHSPIWSAFDGHHLPIELPLRFRQTTEEQNWIFKPWEHLLLTRSQAFHVMKDRFDSAFAEEVIYYTHNSDHINRYLSEDYLMAFQASLFAINQFQLTFLSTPPPDVQTALEQRNPGYKQFANNGILGLLSKGEAPHPIIF